jgi:hypothetical protein
MEQNKTEQALRSLIDLGCTVEDIMEAASKIEEEQNQQPERLHDSSIDIRERIKTLDDAVAYLGEDNPFVMVYNATKGKDIDILAYTKLRIIAAALNEEPEGWRPKYQDKDGNGGEYRWYPYFRAVFFGGSADDGSLDGLAFASTGYGFSVANANYGSRLCYKREELAEYSGQQFKDIWEDYLLR